MARSLVSYAVALTCTANGDSAVGGPTNVSIQLSKIQSTVQRCVVLSPASISSAGRHLWRTGVYVQNGAGRGGWCGCVCVCDRGRRCVAQGEKERARKARFDQRCALPRKAPPAFKFINIWIVYCGQPSSDSFHAPKACGNVIFLLVRFLLVLFFFTPIFCVQLLQQLYIYMHTPAIAATS